jgi:hypothetical protein
MGRNVISDGYTMEGYVEGVERHYEAVEFKFRPVFAEDSERMNEKIAKATGPQIVILLCEILAKQITEWSEVRADGTPQPITVDSMRRLPHPLIFRLSRIVRLFEPSDSRPKTDEEAAETSRLLEQYGSLEAETRGN